MSDGSISNGAISNGSISNGVASKSMIPARGDQALAVDGAVGLGAFKNDRCRSPLGTYAECPLCGSDLFPEHAHFRCSGCGWRDSCCD